MSSEPDRPQVDPFVYDPLGARKLSAFEICRQKDVFSAAASLLPEDERIPRGWTTKQFVMIYGTKEDELDMMRMGRTQELKRRFGFWGLFGFITITMCSWELMMTARIPGKYNENVSALHRDTFSWSFLILGILRLLVPAMPTSGGPHQWVSEFGSPGTRKFLSYIAGWLCLVGWHLTSINLLSLMLTYMVDLVSSTSFSLYFNPSLVYCFFLPVLAGITYHFNGSPNRSLPVFCVVAMGLHVCGFLAITVPLFIVEKPMSISSSALKGDTLCNVTRTLNINSMSPMTVVIGLGSGVHMAEEVQGASRVVPLATVSAFFLNTILTTAAEFVYQDLSVSAMQCGDRTITQFHKPMAVFQHITSSWDAGSIMMQVVIYLMFLGCVTSITTASRQMYAMARDGKLSRDLAVLHYNADLMPRKSVCTSIGVVILLSLHPAGLKDLFTTLSKACLLSSYLIPTAFFTYRKIQQLLSLLHSSDDINADITSEDMYAMGNAFFSVAATLVLGGLCVSCFYTTAVPVSDYSSAIDRRVAFGVFAGMIMAISAWYVMNGGERFNVPVPAPEVVVGGEDFR